MEPKKLPEGYQSTHHHCDVWRVGQLFTWGSGFNPPRWIKEPTRLSIRPGESGKDAYKREFGEILKGNGYVLESTR